MKSYPVMWGLFHKPWNKDPYILNNQYFMETTWDLIKPFFWDKLPINLSCTKVQVSRGLPNPFPILEGFICAIGSINSHCFWSNSDIPSGVWVMLTVSCASQGGSKSWSRFSPGFLGRGWERETEEMICLHDKHIYIYIIYIYILY